MSQSIRDFFLELLDRLLPETPVATARPAPKSVPATTPPEPSEPPPYRVFTHEFDRIVAAQDLDAVLGPLSPEKAKAFQEALEAFAVAQQGWRIKVLAKNIEAIARIKRKITDAERSNTVIALLIDHSGSMRGPAILLTAAATKAAAEFLGLLGIRIEILGFTTVSWRGGQSREKWLHMGRPPQPGRLCDLLHIVYTTDHSRFSRPSLESMLREDLLKENVDGEAIEWAAERLRAGKEARKIILVISDGAPVDDSTLTYNEKGILDRHLHKVIADIEASDDIEIAAIGIGHDPSHYYYDAVTLQAPEDLGNTLIGLIEEVLSGHRPKHYTHWRRRAAGRSKMTPNALGRARLPRSHGSGLKGH